MSVRPAHLRSRSEEPRRKTDAATDTAQAYRNEAEAGVAIRESGLERKEIFITTKYSGLDGLDIKTSINNSLKNVRLSLPTPCCGYGDFCAELNRCTAGRELRGPLPHPPPAARRARYPHCVEGDGGHQGAGPRQVRLLLLFSFPSASSIIHYLITLLNFPIHILLHIVMLFSC